MPFTVPHGRDKVRALAREARDHGIPARTVRHDKYGWSAWTTTPWHDRPVRIMDLYDVQYMHAELAYAA